MADVGIIGMGVAGMTAALSAAEHGLKVDIFDRMTDVASPIGGGFALNGALLCLTKLGYRHIYDKHMVTINNGHQIGSDGKDKTVKFGEYLKGSDLEGHFGFFRRVDVMKSMYEALEKHPNVSCHLNHKATSLTQNADKATVSFENGKSFSYKSILSADGIHSIGQKHVYANEEELPKPEHTGYCIYYGLFSEMPDTMTHGDTYEFSLDGYLVLILPLISGEALFVMAHPRIHQDDPNAWSYHCTVDDLCETMRKNSLFSKHPYLQEKHIRKIYRIVHLGIYQNPILPKWHRGRVCIIGDAAHATSPALGQGANQAMQDGYLVGEYLAKYDSPEKAFEELFKVPLNIITVKSKLLLGSKS